MMKKLSLALGLFLVAVVPAVADHRAEAEKLVATWPEASRAAAQALNLANDIITGKRTLAEARDFYAKTAMAFKEGKKDPYTQGLLFRPGTKAAGDPDQPSAMIAKKQG